jgi:hypothetical protein
MVRAIPVFQHHTLILNIQAQPSLGSTINVNLWRKGRELFHLNQQKANNSQ